MHILGHVNELTTSLPYCCGSAMNWYTYLGDLILAKPEQEYITEREGEYPTPLLYSVTAVEACRVITFIIIFMCVVFDLWWHHGNCSNTWPLLVRIVWLASIHCVSTVKFHTHEYNYKGCL